MSLRPPSKEYAFLSTLAANSVALAAYVDYLEEVAGTEKTRLHEMAIHSLLHPDTLPLTQHQYGRCTGLEDLITTAKQYQK